MLLATFFTLALSQQTATIDDNQELTRAISVRCDAEPLSLVCKKLSYATGVTLTADPLIAEDLVVLSAKGRPGRDVLSKLATHFDLQWIPQEGGYQLAPSKHFVKEQQRTFQKWRMFWSRFDPKVGKQYDMEWSKVDQLGLHRRRQRAYADYAAARKKSGSSKEDYKKLQAFVDRLPGGRHSADPLYPVANAVLANLTPDDLVRIVQGRIVYSTDPKGFQQPFPASVLPVVRRSESLLRQLLLMGPYSKAVAQYIDPPDLDCMAAMSS